MKIQIFDYSIERIEAGLIRQWLPKDAEVLTHYIDSEESFPLETEEVTHIIHSGSSLSIREKAPFTERAIESVRTARDKSIPQMGICYGHQLICLALVGEQAVQRSAKGLEVGWGEVAFREGATQIPGTSSQEKIWQHHFDEVIILPEGSELIATGKHTPIQAFVNFRHRLFGTQFHPEFDRERGNRFFLEDRKLIESHQYRVDEIIQSGPSLNAGQIFFSFFLNFFNQKPISSPF
ncbi:MAG: hypothetical protein HQM13_04350 [SAR324 cluster bacterium]|nr:hypothetical protein [SAR324 cluster bacterium]